MRYVFLPGLDGTGMLFEPVAQRLTGKPEPLIVSYPANRYLNYPALEQYVLPQLPVEEPYLLIAESFGGPLAISITSRHLPFLRGLVLSATFVKKPRGWLGVWSRFLLSPILFKKGLLNSVGRSILTWQGLSEHQIALLLRAIEYSQPAVLVARLKEALDVDEVEDLKRCDVPVLCLFAKKDWVIDRTAHALIAAANPRVRQVGLDTPHFLLQAKPDEALREIVSFARTLEVPA